jgi:tRNA (cytidine32/guanosine34-2'-O)-methyltransferase
MKLFFRKVEICKPAASRDSSIESFIVCREHFKPEGYQLSMMPMFMDDKQENLLGINRYICPFVACGSLEGYDSDMTYPLTGEYIEPVQKPIDPPYQAYLNAKRGN